jgi:hypothetical protein
MLTDTGKWCLLIRCVSIISVSKKESQHVLQSCSYLPYPLSITASKEENLNSLTLFSIIEIYDFVDPKTSASSLSVSYWSLSL